MPKVRRHFDYHCLLQNVNLTHVKLIIVGHVESVLVQSDVLVVSRQHLSMCKKYKKKAQKVFSPPCHKDPCPT